MLEAHRNVNGSSAETGRAPLPVSGTVADEDLMLAAANGDMAAFEQLVRRHQSSAWSAAYRFLGDHADAEDVVQEAFLKLYRAASRYQPTAAFRTYLYRIVTRLCLDHVAKKRPASGHDLPELATDAPTQLEAAIAADRQVQVRSALERLAPNQRMAVILKYFHGMGYHEIAESMETTSKAVERLLARARETLEKILTPLLD